MPRGDGTGPYGTFINCTDPATGLTRPLYRYRYGGYVPPVPPAAAPQTYLPPTPPAYPRYSGYAPRGYPYGGYGYPGYGYPRYGYPGYGYGLGLGLGRRRGRGWGGGGRGRW
jgi:hypothetical protein